jgi:hypothetical protein
MAEKWKRDDNASASEDKICPLKFSKTVWNEYWQPDEEAWISLYYTVLLTCAVREKRPINPMKDRRICTLFNSQFQAFNDGDLRPEGVIFPKRLYPAWKAKCDALIPNVLTRLNSVEEAKRAHDHSEGLEEDGKKIFGECKPRISYDILVRYKELLSSSHGLSLDFDEDHPEKIPELKELILANMPETSWEDGGINNLERRGPLPEVDRDYWHRDHSRAQNAQGTERRKLHAGAGNALLNMAIIPPMGVKVDLNALKKGDLDIDAVNGLTEEQKKDVKEDVRLSRVGESIWKNLVKDPEDTHHSPTDPPLDEEKTPE